MRVPVDGASWPGAGNDLDTLEHKLRYEECTHSDRLRAAAVLSAYRALIDASETKRRRVVRAIRAARKVTP